MIGGEPGGIVFLEQAQPALVELVERHLATVQVIENAEVHPVLLPGRPALRPCQGYTPTHPPEVARAGARWGVSGRSGARSPRSQTGGPRWRHCGRVDRSWLRRRLP